MSPPTPATPPAPPAPPAPPTPLGAISFNVQCRLMQDLCAAINMKSCAQCSFHLNVIKHTISFGYSQDSLYVFFCFFSISHAGRSESSFSAPCTSQGKFQKKNTKMYIYNIRNKPPKMYSLNGEGLLLFRKP